MKTLRQWPFAILIALIVIVTTGVLLPPLRNWFDWSQWAFNLIAALGALVGIVWFVLFLMDRRMGRDAETDDES